jgi:hypothetical protein
MISRVIVPGALHCYNGRNVIMFSYSITCYTTLGTAATTRAGDPEPPTNFNGMTNSILSVAGNCSIFPLRFSMPYTPCESKIRCDWKSFDEPGSSEAVTGTYMRAQEQSLR